MTLPTSISCTFLVFIKSFLAYDEKTFSGYNAFKWSNELMGPLGISFFINIQIENFRN